MKIIKKMPCHAFAIASAFLYRLDGAVTTDKLTMIASRKIGQKRRDTSTLEFHKKRDLIFWTDNANKIKG
jgi:hypothetical protein